MQSWTLSQVKISDAGLSAVTTKNNKNPAWS